MKTSAVVLVLILPLSTSAQPSSGGGMTRSTYLAVQAAGISTLGNFSEDWEGGAGGYIGYGIDYADGGGLAFQTGYLKYREAPAADLGEDPSFVMIPFMVGGRYYLLREGFRPYVFAMSGVNLIERKYVNNGTPIDDTVVKLDFQIGVGLQFGVFTNLALEVAGKYNSHVLDPNVPENATGLEFGVGLTWALGN